MDEKRYWKVKEYVDGAEVVVLIIIPIKSHKQILHHTGGWVRWPKYQNFVD